MDRIRTYKKIEGLEPDCVGILQYPDPDYVFISCVDCKYRMKCDHRGCKAREELGEPMEQPRIKIPFWEYDKAKIFAYLKPKTDMERAWFFGVYTKSKLVERLENQHNSITK